MKKIFNKIQKTFLIFSILFEALLLVSCQDPIFFEIRREVKLEEATILGDVNSIVRFTNNRIFCSNGNIYSKEESQQVHGGWQKHSSPEGIIHQIAADKNYLYALALTFTEDTRNGKNKVSSFKVYYSADAQNWTYLTDLNSDTNKISTLICTNAVKPEHRFAYINDNGTVKKLDGGSTPSTVSAPTDTRSCAYLGGNTYFFSTYAACSNETSTTDATKIYFGSGGNIKIKTTSGDSDFGSGHRSTINGIAVTKDALLVVTSSGSTVVNLSTREEEKFANITSTLSTLYEGRACLAVNPEKNAKDTTLYASHTVYGTGSNSALFSHAGLWSYYSNRGTWNIE